MNRMRQKKWQTRNRDSFLNTRSNLDQLVEHAFIDGNQAVIPCRAESYQELISAYSAKGYETLNPAFQAYLMDISRYIPDEYPIVLEIRGKAFTESEQETIRNTIRTDMMYALGEVEAENDMAFRNFLVMMAGALGMGVFLTLAKFVIHIAEEFFYIIFWFFADTLVRYLLQDRRTKKYNRLLAGRMARMSVRFCTDDEA